MRLWGRETIVHFCFMVKAIALIMVGYSTANAQSGFGPLPLSRQIFIAPDNLGAMASPQVRPGSGEPGQIGGPQWYYDIGIVARGVTVFDTTQLANFSGGQFVPAAIPVFGENFYQAGERATVQGSGSVVQLTAAAPTPAGAVSMGGSVVVVQPSPGSVGVEIGAVYVDFRNFTVGLLDTAFADPYSVIETIDVAGPNAEATILSPNGTMTQGRLSYIFGFSGDRYTGLFGTLSVEAPVPEISFNSGITPATSYVTFAHVPDLVLTLKASDGDDSKPNAYEEYWHVQFGTVLRDLGIENGNKTVDESAFGWGLQLSGSNRLFPDSECQIHDSFGYSIIYGRGIGHYINDLHVVATGQKTGGNDAILNGSTLETLPALAYYTGYQHVWDKSFATNIGWSRVQLDGVPGQSPSAYHFGDYFVANLIYHQPVNLVGPTPATAVKNFYAGVEYLYGVKEELSGRSGQDNRFMLMLSFNK